MELRFTTSSKIFVLLRPCLDSFCERDIRFSNEIIEIGGSIVRLIGERDGGDPQNVYGGKGARQA